MKNIQTKLRDLRKNITYVTENEPIGIDQIKLKGQFSIDFPIGFNAGISADEIGFIKRERTLLLNSYNEWGFLAEWDMEIWINEKRLANFRLDFTSFRFNDNFCYLNFKITPLLDKVRVFDKNYPTLMFENPENLTVKKKFPIFKKGRFLDTECYNNNNQPDSLNELLSFDQLDDINGIEWFADIPNYDGVKKSIISFRVRQRSSGERIQIFQLHATARNVKMVQIRNGLSAILSLDLVYDFHYTDGTQAFTPINKKTVHFNDGTSPTYIYNYIISANQLTLVDDFSTLPNPFPNKDIAECYIHLLWHSELVVAIPAPIPHIFKCEEFKLYTNYIQINRNDFRNVSLEDYFNKVNSLSPLFDFSDTQVSEIFRETYLTASNFANNGTNELKTSLLDLIETISMACGLMFIEKNNVYKILPIDNFIQKLQRIRLRRYFGDDYKTENQYDRIAIGDDTTNKLPFSNNIFGRKYYSQLIENFVPLDDFSLVPKIGISGETLLNSIIFDNTDKLMLYNVHYDMEQGYEFSEFFANERLIERVKKFIFSKLPTEKPLYRPAYIDLSGDNMPATVAFQQIDNLFSRYSITVTAETDYEFIFSMLQDFKLLILNDGRAYLPVEFSLNIEPNTTEIKLLRLE